MVSSISFGTGLSVSGPAKSQEATEATEVKQVEQIASIDISPTDQAQIEKSETLADAARVLGIDASVLVNSTKAKMIHEAERLNRKNDTDAHKTAQIAANEHAQELNKRANSLSYAGSLEAQIEAREELERTSSEAADRTDFSIGEGEDLSGVWDSQVLATIVKGATEILSSGQKVPFGLLAALKQGSITEQNTNRLNVVNALEQAIAEEDDSIAAYRETAKETGASEEEIAQRHEVHRQKVNALKTQIDSVNAEIDANSTEARRLEDFEAEREDASEKIREAVGTEGRGFFKATSDIAGAIGNKLALEAATGPELMMIAYNTANGTSDRELAQDVKNLSGFIAENEGKINVGDDTLDAEGIQDPEIQGALISDLTVKWEATTDLRESYTKAVESGDDIQAARDAAELVIRLGAGVSKAFIDNPKAAAHLAGEESIQFLAGVPLKGAALVGGTVARGVTRGVTRNSLAKDIGKEQAKIKVRGNDTSFHKIRQGNKKLDSIDRSTAVLSKGGDALSKSTVFMESAGQGVSIYNQAMQDYLEKTNGQLPSKEEAQAMMSAAMLAGSLDLFTDTVIGKSSGLLKKVHGNKRKNASITPADKERIAKGVANRTIRTAGTGVASTLVKSGKIAAKNASGTAAEAGTEGLQTDLELNLANYLLGKDREEGSDLEVFLAASQGAIAAGALQGPGAVVDTAKQVGGSVVETGKNVASAVAKDLEVSKASTVINKAKDSASERGVGGGSVKFFDAGSTTPLDFNKPETIESAITNSAGFVSQADKALRNLLRTSKVEGTDKKVDEVLKNVEKVRSGLRKQLLDDKKLSPAEYDQLESDYQKIKAIQGKYSELSKPKEASASKLAQSYAKQKQAGVDDKDLAFDKDDLDNVTTFFGTSPISFSTNDKESKTTKEDMVILQHVAASTGNTDLAIALFGRINDAKNEGRIRKLAGRRQSDNQTIGDASVSFVDGSAEFVGIKEYLVGAASISQAAKKSGNAKDVKRADAILETIIEQVRTLATNRLQKTKDLNSAINSFNAGGLTAQDNANLVKYGITFNPQGAVTLRDQVKAEFEATRAAGIRILDEQKILNASETTSEDEVEETVTEPTEAKAQPKAEVEAKESVSENESEVVVSETEDTETAPPREDIPVTDENAPVAASVEETLEESVNGAEDVLDIDLSKTTRSEGSLGQELIDSLPESLVADPVAELSKLNEGRKVPFKSLLPKNIDNLVKKFFTAKNPLTKQGRELLTVIKSGTPTDFKLKTEKEADIYILQLVEVLAPRVAKALDADPSIIAKEIFADDKFADGPMQRYNSDKTHYLKQILVNGKVPESVKDSITLGLANYIAQRGIEFNELSTQDIVMSFGYTAADYNDRGVRVPDSIVNKYKHKGIKDTQLIKDVGKNAYRYLGLKENAESGENFGQQIELLLGGLATHVLNDEANADIFKINTETNGNYNADRDTARGLESKTSNTFRPPATPGTRKFYTFNLPKTATAHSKSELFKKVLGFQPIDPKSVLLAHNEGDDTLLDISQREWATRPKGSQYRFDAIFLAKAEHKMPKLTAEEAQRKYKARSNNDLFNYPAELAEDLEKHNETPYKVQTELFTLFNKFYFGNTDTASREQFLELLGFTDLTTMDRKINALVETQEGKNLQIEGDLDKFAAFADIIENSGVDIDTQQFFLTTDLQRQNRLHFVDTAINPLLSKIHRSLFVLDGNESIDRDTFAPETFYRRVAMLQKMGRIGDTDDEATIEQNFEELLFSEEFNNALGAYRAMIDDSNDALTPDQWTALKTFTSKADYPSAAFEVLADEVKRTSEDTGTYETDLTVAMDGISSGLAISMVFLSGGGPNVDKVIKKMGIFTENSTEQSLSEVKATNDKDAYETVAFSFLEHIGNLANEFDKRTAGIPDDGLTFVGEGDNDLRAKALLHILTTAEGFTLQDGKVDDTSDNRNKVRKLMKTGIVAKTFGQKEQGQADGIRDWIIKSAHTILDDAMSEHTQDLIDFPQDKREANIKLRTTVNNLNETLGVFGVPGTEYIDIRNLTKTNLKKGQFKFDLKVSKNKSLVGLAGTFNDASDEVLGDFVDNRENINNVLNAQYTIFETVRNKLIKQAESRYEQNEKHSATYDIKADKSSSMNLPKRARKQIDDRLRVIMPKIKTPYSKSKDQKDYLPLFKLENKDSTEKSDSFRSGDLYYGLRKPSTSFKLAGATITAIHAFEAAIALMSATQHPVLSTHDAQTVTLQNAAAHNQTMNNTMVDLLNGYNVMESVMDGVLTANGRLQAELQNVIGDLAPTELAEINKVLEVALGISKDSIRPSNSMPAKAAVDKNYRDYMNLVKETKATNVKLVSEITANAHYALANNKYETGVKPAKEIIPDNAFDDIPTTIGSSPIVSENSIFGKEGTQDFGLTARNIVDKLQMLRNTGHRAESQAHMDYLTNFMGKIANPHIQDIQVHYNATGKFPAAGEFGISQSGMDIWMNASETMNEQATRLPDHGIAMSGAEILAHEVAHSLTSNLIEQGHPIMKEVEKLWEIAEANEFITAADLIPDGDTAPDALARAQTTYDYIFTPRIVEKRTRLVAGILPVQSAVRKRSAHLDEFVAFMMTNEKLREKLAKVEPSAIVTRSDKLLERWGNRMARVLNKAYVFLMNKLKNYKFDSNDTDYTAQFDQLMGELFVTDTLTNNKLLAATDSLSRTVNNVAEKGVETAKYAMNQTRHSDFVEHLGGKYGKGLNNVLDFIQESDDVKKAVIKPVLDTAENYMSSIDLFGIEEILAEIRGSTDRSKFASDLIRFRNTYESKERQETMDSTRKVLTKPFLFGNETEVGATLKKALFDGLIRTDVASLLHKNISVERTKNGLVHTFEDRTREELTDYIGNIVANGAQADIGKVRADIANLVGDPALTNAYHRSAKSLGKYLVEHRHGEAIGTASVELIIRDVASQLDKPLDFDIEMLRFHLNTLGTLEALKRTPPEILERAHDEMLSHSFNEEQDDGVFRLISAHKELQDSALTSELFTNKTNFIKGYYKEVASNPDISPLVALASDEKALASQLYVKKARVFSDPLNPNQEARYLYITEYSASTTAMIQGAISGAAKPASGRSFWEQPKKVVSENADGSVTYDLEHKFKEVNFNRTKAIRQQMTKPVDDTEDEQSFPSSASIRINSDGTTEMYDWRGQMGWAEKVEHLGTMEDPFDTLAHTAGNMVSKIRGRKVNQLVVNELVKDYAENKASLPVNSYTFIGPGQKKGSKNEERWAMIPKETREYIVQATGEEGIYVRRDLANSIFGYRKVSVRNLISHLEQNKDDAAGMNNLMRKSMETTAGQYLFRTVVLGEDIMADLTSIIKDSVVVKSIFVNAVNVLSNTVQLMTNGMSAKDAIFFQTEALTNGVKYSIDHARRKDIRVELTTLRSESAHKAKLETELAKIEDKLSRNPVAFLFEAGAMQTIVEDIQSARTEDPSLNRQPVTKLGKTILSKSPKFLEIGLSEATMSENTAFYKWANNAVKLSDFSSRYALIKHLEAKQPELSSDERIRKAMDEFIDYDIPTNRWVQYLNDIGLFWFTKYGLRSAGVAARLAVEHPANIAKLYLVESLFGDISTVMDFNAPGRFGTPWGRLESAIEDIATFNFAASLLD